MNIWQIGSIGAHLHQNSIRVGSFVEVTFGVHPIAPGHQAGAVWTADGWETACWTEAGWTQNPDGFFEQWQVTLHIPSNATHPGADPTFRVWYALYARDAQGDEVWDNNNGWNYEYIIPGPYDETTPAPCQET